MCGKSVTLSLLFVNIDEMLAASLRLNSALIIVSRRTLRFVVMTPSNEVLLMSKDLTVMNENDVIKYAHDGCK